MHYTKKLSKLRFVEWGRKYLSYEKLKFKIDSLDGPESHKALEDGIISNLTKVETFYTLKLDEINSLLEMLEKKSNLFTNLNISSIDSEELSIWESELSEWSLMIDKLFKYAKLNKQGFQKIFQKLKKLDITRDDLEKEFERKLFVDNAKLNDLYQKCADFKANLVNVQEKSKKDKGSEATLLLQFLKEDNLSDYLTTHQLEADFLPIALRKALDLNARKSTTLLMEKGITTNSVCYFNQRTPLHYLAVTGNYEMLEFLVKSFAGNIAPKDIFGKTPLHYASSKGFSKCVKILIDNGASIYSLDSDGMSPIFYCVKEGSLECLKVLLSKCEKSPSGQHINIPISNGTASQPILNLACERGKSQMAEILIEKGMDVNDVDEDGCACIHLSSKAGSLECTSLLISKGANVNIKDNLLGWTPLFYAASEGNKEVVEILLNSGADPNVLDSEGWSCTDHAVLKGHIATIDALLKKTSNKIEGQHKKPLKQKLEKKSEEYTTVYGHGCLEGTGVLQIFLGGTDVRYGFCPIELNSELDLTNWELRVSVSDSETAPVTVDLPIEPLPDPLSFKVKEIAKCKLIIDVVSVFNKKRVLARGLALPSTFSKNSFGFVEVPLMNQNLEEVGLIRFQYFHTTPFTHPNMSQENKNTYWKTTQIIGHRGTGAEKSSKIGKFRRSHITENTVLSFVTAASLGANYVEFDVHVTSDGVPIVYHDWRVKETGFGVPVYDMTLDMFLKLNEKKPTELNPNKKRQRSNSFDSSTDSLNKVGNADFVGLKDKFTTLEDVFKRVPKSVGFNIEVKYPSKGEREKFNLGKKDLNKFIDTILKCVYDNVGNRQIVFSSFSPESCLALNLKQKNFPVVFLTDGGLYDMGDMRCMSLYEAIKFAKSANLIGIVSNVAPLVTSPNLIKLVKESGLILMTYGTANNEVNAVKLQKELGVDGVITDHISYVSQALLSSSSS